MQRKTRLSESSRNGTTIRRKSSTQKNLYNTRSLQKLRKEKKVVEYCVKYLTDVIWPLFETPPRVLELQNLFVSTENSESCSLAFGSVGIKIKFS